MAARHISAQLSKTLDSLRKCIEQYVAVMSGWGGAVPLWGGEVAKTFKDISQGGSLWVFKLAK